MPRIRSLMGSGACGAGEGPAHVAAFVGAGRASFVAPASADKEVEDDDDEVIDIDDDDDAGSGEVSPCALSWRAFHDYDVDIGDDADAMAFDGDLELCREHCRRRGFGGFVIHGDWARFKAAPAQALALRLVRGSGTTHLGYPRAPLRLRAAEPFAPTAPSSAASQASVASASPERRAEGRPQGPWGAWQAASFRDAAGRPEAGRSVGVWLDRADFVLAFEDGHTIGSRGVVDVGLHGFPRNWPRVYSESAVLKGMLKRSGPCSAKRAPKVVGVPEEGLLAHIQEVPLLPLQSFENAVAIADRMGLRVVKGWAIYDVLNMNPGDAYMAEHYWWNADDRGEWFDFTPRSDTASSLLLVEAAAPPEKEPRLLHYEQVALSDSLACLRLERASAVVRAELESGCPAVSVALRGAETKAGGKLRAAMDSALIQGALGRQLTNTKHTLPTVLLLAVLIRCLQQEVLSDNAVDLFIAADGVDALLQLLASASCDVAAAAAAALGCICRMDRLARLCAAELGGAQALADLFGRPGMGSPRCPMADAALLIWRSLDAQPPSATGGSSPPERGARQEGRSYWEPLRTLCWDALRAQHAAELPRDRRAHSWARSLAFARVALGAKGGLRRGDERQPFVVWVLGAEDSVEAQLAAEGYFRDVNFVDRAPMEVLLIGSGLRELSIGGYGCGGRPCEGEPAAVRTVSHEALLWMGRLLPSGPDLVATFMPDVPDEAGAGPLRNPLDGLPEEVLAAIAGVPVAISTRYGLTESSAMMLRCKLRDQIVMPQVRSPFSAKASRGRPSLGVLDDNGWVFVVRGAAALARAMQLEVPLSYGPPPGGSRTTALFWGILDIKYDVERPVLERVKVLETGDGRTSKFSGDGAPILQRFREKYQLEEDMDFHMYRVLSADKKLTHDAFERSGYEHLTPKQVCMPRKYHTSLAGRIVEGLGVSGDDLVVLKLCNRARAAGVLVTPARELDEVLRDVLMPPRDFERWSEERVRHMRSGAPVDFGCGGSTFEEQRRHWWSNESPVFLAERCCHSLPTVVEGRSFDGTLRVGFALRPRQDQANKPWEQFEAIKPDDFEVDWLGGYWKLPKGDSTSSSLREMVVSAARTSGTSLVRATHLLEVYAALGDAVQELFASVEPSVASEVLSSYGGQPELAAYLTARLGTASSLRSPMRGREFLDASEGALAKAGDMANTACVASFLQRVKGVMEVRQGAADRWQNARPFFEAAIERQPTNSNALYLLGMAALFDDRADEAIDLLSKSLLMDPDFRAGYVNLAIGYLRLGDWGSALEVSEAGLARHPDAPQPHYHIGVAACQLALEVIGGSPADRDDPSYQRYRQLSLRGFVKARSTDEARRRYRLRQEGVLNEAPWLEADDQMMEAMESESYACIELPRTIGWTWTNFRA